MDPTGNNPQNELESVLADYLRKLDAGVRIDRAELLVSHPELADELRAYFEQERLLWAAADPAETATMQATSTPGGSLEVRCPHCHAPMEVAVDTVLTDLTCDSCGSHFSLVDQSKATRMAPSLSKLGRFELIERIGVGGFGSVWKARDKELDRTVAIKIPRQGDMIAEEQEKFFREARAAAQLRHPGIVSVHEVGRDGDSVYIVSDFVRGVTLGDWLTAQQVTSREAAQFCAKIADALEHAHERGVVHRDLKPANVMIDGDGEPHLMDFGLARREVGEVTVTMDGQVLGTPAYMSPEQAEGEAHTADRRSDIYSLGVIFFQLLTGELPFRGNARMLIYQAVHDEPPSPRKLNATAPKDLETITLKCLEKNPERRYQTAHDVSQEIHRFLKGEPIHARPVGRLERTWRWCRRNRLAAGLLVAVWASLVAGIAASSYFALVAWRETNAAKVALDKAERHRKEAEQVNEFFVNEVFGLADPIQQNPAELSLRDALYLGAERIEERFPEDARLQIVIRENLGQIFLGIDEPQKAIDQFRAALTLHARVSGELDPKTLKCKCDLADAFHLAQDGDKAMALYRVTWNQQIDTLGAGHPDALRTAIKLGMVMRALQEPGDLEHAEAIYQQSLESLGPNHITTYLTQSHYAWTLRWHGQYVEALKIVEPAADGLRRLLGETHRDAIYAQYNHAACLQMVGRYDEAAEKLQIVLLLRQRVLGVLHVSTLWTAARLASVHASAGRLPDAINIAEKHVESNINEIRESGRTASSEALRALAQVFVHDDPARAVRLQKIVLDMRQKELGDTNRRTLDAALRLAAYHFYAGNDSDGKRVAESALDKLESAQLQDRVSVALKVLLSSLRSHEKTNSGSVLNDDLQRRLEKAISSAATP